MIDSTPKYPVIPDDDLLTLIQQQTFRYFWDFGHPSCGMARERDNSGDIVTIGGSGFGLMAIPVAIERSFITRSEGIERIATMVNFLKNADRFHGAWAHWYNGATGHVVPFSTYDNGGDLVETSYMAQALLTVRQYLSAADPAEAELINNINLLLDGIEWSWYNRDNLNMLSWHWSPSYGWAMNMFVRGWNEALITYIMAATSSTFPISAEVYHNGWAGNGAIVNGRSFYGYTLPLGHDYGGPLFFAQYSFLGLNPQNLSDQYASYWTQNVNHTLINRQYCITNPRGYLLYSPDCWGLTASDDNNGYGAHEPLNDNGTITPTAALSSMPYTPEESMRVARFLYYTLGDKLWGDYGFYDAFNPTAGWWGKSYLAIDQGPIIIMIENYRTGLCWNLFMSAPEVDGALSKLGFSH
ncbi:MAG TPA: glucoamylase family protein [Tenuifilaceae bacterium]|nr:glucoamylase family protein [Tenuifilaceae bacterium]